MKNESEIMYVTVTLYCKLFVLPSKLTSTLNSKHSSLSNDSDSFPTKILKIEHNP